MPGEEKIKIRFAGFWLRGLAMLIDAVFINIIATLIVYLAFLLFPPESLNFAIPDVGRSLGAIFSSVFTLIISLITAIFGYYIYTAAFESSSFRATPGKLLLGLEVVSEDTLATLSFLRALSRNLGKVLSGLIMGIGYLMAAFTAKKQALHDRLTKSLVIKNENYRFVNVFLGLFILAVLIIFNAFLPTYEQKVKRSYLQSEKLKAYNLQNTSKGNFFENLSIQQSGNESDFVNAPDSQDFFEEHFSKTDQESAGINSALAAQQKTIERQQKYWQAKQNKGQNGITKLPNRDRRPAEAGSYRKSGQSSQSEGRQFRPGNVSGYVRVGKKNVTLQDVFIYKSGSELNLAFFGRKLTAQEKSVSFLPVSPLLKLEVLPIGNDCQNFSATRLRLVERSAGFAQTYRNANFKLNLDCQFEKYAAIKGSVSGSGRGGKNNLTPVSWGLEFNSVIN